MTLITHSRAPSSRGAPPLPSNPAHAPPQPRLFCHRCPGPHDVKARYSYIEVRVDFDTATQRVTARVHDLDVALRIGTRQGAPLEPWDLHIGAVLNIMGKKVTLRGASLAVRLGGRLKGGKGRSASAPAPPCLASITRDKPSTRNPANPFQPFADPALAVPASGQTRQAAPPSGGGAQQVHVRHRSPGGIPAQLPVPRRRLVPEPAGPHRPHQRLARGYEPAEAH